jgi:ESCRT-I complex subunit VPS28
MAYVPRPKTSEVRAYESSKERSDLNMLSDLYSIIKVTDLLEAAYSRDAITATEYHEECAKLIAQFKATANLIAL